MQQRTDNIIHRIAGKLRRTVTILFYHLCCLLPLQNKIVARSFEGRQLGDNPKGIMENLLGLNLDLVWITKAGKKNSPPEGMRAVRSESTFQMLYEYATAKVWIDTHHVPLSIRKKRKDQILIETWHGGLGIKKLELEVPAFQASEWTKRIVNHTNEMADVFLSNSDHLTKVYRSAFGYTGKVWKSGYPKNDVILCGASREAHNRVCDAFSINRDTRIVIYAPTYRDGHCDDTEYLNNIYSLDCQHIQQVLCQRFGGHWALMIRLHPVIETEQLHFFSNQAQAIINATSYPDMQELILSADAFISDYSSCIFDAALRNIPCFIYATDFDEYKRTRGIYYEMGELPFPYATNNDELMEIIRNYDHEVYLRRWEAFKVCTGLHETGHAGRDIARLINEYIKGNRKPLEEIKSEP